MLEISILWMLDVGIFLPSVQAFTLYPLNKPLRAGLHIGGVGFVRIDVHREGEARVHSHEHVTKDQLSISGDPHAHD